MAPQESNLKNDPSPTGPVSAPSPIPPPVPVETHPNRRQLRPIGIDSSRLAPFDSHKYIHAPKLRPLHENVGIEDSPAVAAVEAALRPAIASLRAPPAIPPVAARLEQERRLRNASHKKRQQPRVWKKLLWIKQHGFPDNYTDNDTFLDHLQWNPRLRPYDFWSLVENSIVIVQHVCSVAIFVSAYAGIYQDRLSPVAVVTCGSIASLIGWIMWDSWMGEEEVDDQAALDKALTEIDTVSNPSSADSAGNRNSNGFLHGNIEKQAGRKGLGLSLSTSNLATKNNETKLNGTSRHDKSFSKSSFQSISPIDPLNETFPDLSRTLSHRSIPSTHVQHASVTTFAPPTSHRNQVRMKTFKSALLIYFALLGISPILKSLTKSTSSDSIWALATWLLIINIFFFDYGSVYLPEDKLKLTATATAASRTSKHSPTLTKTQARLRSMSVATTPAGAIPGTIKATSSTPHFPSSLSTNAALMASTVLASRLPTTTSVFSLSLFSIQVFGLFPVFRRHLKYKSPQHLHILLTILLIGMSSCGLFLILSQSYTHTYGDCGYCWGWIWHVLLRSVAGMIVGGCAVMFVMGACSWWLISLQRYKNVVIGPWDPAKPVLAGGVSVLGRGRGGTD